MQGHSQEKTALSDLLNSDYGRKGRKGKQRHETRKGLLFPVHLLIEGADRSEVSSLFTKQAVKQCMDDHSCD